MTSYTVLTGSKATAGSIQNLVNDDRVSASIMLTLAQQWIWERLRIREMLTEAPGTLVTTATTVALPTRFKAPYQFSIIGSAANLGGQGELEYKTLAKLRNMYVWDSTGARVSSKPCYYSVDASFVQFDVKPNAAYPYNFLHYAELPVLVAGTNETNVLTTKYLSLLYNACAMKAYEHLRRREERADHLQMALGEIQEANRDSDMSMETQDLRVELV